MHLLREKVRFLRREGFSYREIQKILGVNRSSIHYMVKDIKLTLKQKTRLAKKEKDNRVAFAARPQDREASSRGGRSCQKLHGPRVTQNLKAGPVVGGLAYRKDELPIKVKLEQLYRRSFCKVKVANKYVDFGDEDLLIEHTTDITKGIKDVVERFRKIAETGDTRKRIAFIPMKSRKTTSRMRALADLGVEVHDVRELV